MQQTTLTAGVSSLVLNDIKRIDVTNSAVTSAQQVIRKYLFEKRKFFSLEFQQVTYSTTSTNATQEIQTVLVDVSTFQIGFRGAYTGKIILRKSF